MDNAFILILGILAIVVILVKVIIRFKKGEV